MTPGRVSSCEHDWMLAATVGCPGWLCIKCLAQSESDPHEAEGRSPSPDCENCLGTGETFACILYGQCEEQGCVPMECPCMTTPARLQP